MFLKRFAVVEILINFNCLLKVKFLVLFVTSITTFQVFASDGASGPTPVPVELGVYVYQIYDLDSNKGTFTANISYWIKAPEEIKLPLSEVGVGEIYTKFPVINDKNIWTEPIDDKAVYSIQNLGATFLHNYDLTNFPFDKQKLIINFELRENTDKWIISPDLQTNINKRLLMDGWKISNFKLITSKESYGSNFGWINDKADVSYSRLTMEINVERDAVLLFFKLTLGLFAAVTLAVLSTLIRTNIDDHFSARIGLVGGALLGIIVNQQFADAKIGDSTTVTLIDTLHITGMIVILALFIGTIFSRGLHLKRGEVSALKFDNFLLRSAGAIFIVINLILVYLAL